MATFYEQAQNQLAPAYDQQAQALQSQIPAIQQLYQTLTQGLQQANQTQLNTGVNQIVEDASRRGVLRSSLPVDARQALTAQLGAALNQSLGQLGAQQAQDVAGIGEKIGQLGIQRTQSISDLAGALQNRDLAERQFQFQQEQTRLEAELKRQQAERDFQLAQQEINARAAASGGGGRGPTNAEMRSSVASYIIGQFNNMKGRDGFVGNNTWAGALNDWTAAGYKVKDFWQQFGRYVNTKYKSNYAGYNQR